MDQRSLGLDSEIVIDIAEENIADIDIAVEPELEEPEDEAQAAQDEQTQVDADVEAIMAMTLSWTSRWQSMNMVRRRTSQWST